MTDKEKLAYLIGFLKGTIGYNQYFMTVNVQAMLEAIKVVEEQEG